MGVPRAQEVVCGNGSSTPGTWKRPTYTSDDSLEQSAETESTPPGFSSLTLKMEDTREDYERFFVLDVFFVWCELVLG